MYRHLTVISEERAQMCPVKKFHVFVKTSRYLHFGLKMTPIKFGGTFPNEIWQFLSVKV